jgi:hypothetical protein
MLVLRFFQPIYAYASVLEEDMTLLLIVVVVLLLFGGGGYYGYRRW